MDKKIIEEDWKVFCKIKEIAKERFCKKSLEDYREALEKESMTAVEKDALIYRLSKNRNQHYDLFFADHRRSQMSLQLLAIRGEKLANENLVKELSPELQERSNPTRVNWKDVM